MAARSVSWRVSCAALSVSVVCLCAGTTANAAPEVSLLPIPQSENTCVRITKTEIGATISSSCGAITVVQCDFRSFRRPPSWVCLVRSLNTVPAYLRASAVGPTVYVGACRAGVFDCVRRQELLSSGVSGRKDPNLDILNFAPGNNSCDAPSAPKNCVRGPRG